MPTLAEPKRRKSTDNSHIELLAQINGLCPGCSRTLMHKKSGKTFKGYELAHIYPLKPTDEEKLLLEHEARLNADVNHIDNLIPLCESCHGRFDKPRTVEEYRELVSLKRSLIRTSERRASWYQFPLEAQLEEIVRSLAAVDLENRTAPDLVMDPKEIDRKADGTLSRVTLRKIHHDVQDYFYTVQREFGAIDLQHPGTAHVIAQEIKTYYAKQRTLTDSQEEIFLSVSDWIHARVPKCSNNAADVITAFFVQNCEIFE